MFEDHTPVKRVEKNTHGSEFYTVKDGNKETTVKTLVDGNRKTTTTTVVTTNVVRRNGEI